MFSVYISFFVEILFFFCHNIATFYYIKSLFLDFCPKRFLDNITTIFLELFQCFYRNTHFRNDYNFFVKNTKLCHEWADSSRHRFFSVFVQVCLLVDSICFNLQQIFYVKLWSSAETSDSLWYFNCSWSQCSMFIYQ